MAKMTVIRRQKKLPTGDASLAMAVYRFEKVSRAIRRSFDKRSARKAGDSRLCIPLRAYVHFRSRAFELLAHYIDEGLEEAFDWSLKMNGASIRKKKSGVSDNLFYPGLLAMCGAAGQFMSRNKLRDLARLMQRAHDEGVSSDDLESCFRTYRNADRNYDFLT